MIAVREGGNRDSDLHLWFIHGLGDSSRNFDEAFSERAVANFHLFAPDLPGFGESPARPDGYTIASVAGLIRSEIGVRSPGARIVLVGHSIGSLVVTRIARRAGGRIRGVISVEGNLTRDDTFVSGRALEYDQGEPFHRTLVAEAKVKHEQVPLHARHYESIRKADPITFWALGRSAASETGESAGGEAFASLPHAKTYYWGTTSTPESTRSFLNTHHIEQRPFEGIGHWPMLEAPGEFYGGVGEDALRMGGLRN